MKTTEQLTDLFRERGLRVTPQRQMIFGLLQGNDAHPTVESLYERLAAVGLGYLNSIVRADYPLESRILAFIDAAILNRD